MSNKAWEADLKHNQKNGLMNLMLQLISTKNLIDQDVQGSIAHATMLANQNIISQDEAHTIIEGLKAIQKDVHQNKIAFKASLEDIHLNIEHELIQRVGEAGGKLHTGRSRNDQVATDMHLY